MSLTRLSFYAATLFIALTALAVYPFARVGHAQNEAGRDLKPDMRRALNSRQSPTSISRKSGYTPLRDKSTLETRASARTETSDEESRKPARVAKIKSNSGNEEADSAITPRIRAGTPLSRVLHTSQLSITSSAGSDEQFVDQSGDLVADERTTFDATGGSFDISVGRSGARYEVYSAIDNNGTSNPSDDVPVGVLVVALDTNGDYVRDSSSTFDLERDFQLPSAASVVSGTSKAGREFVIVSSSGYYNFNNPADPNNEPSAGVVLLVRDPSTGGFDNSRSREIVKVGSNQLNNANALALLPNNDLLIADFDSNELRIVRDTNADGIPDTLSATPYYSYRFSNDAPLDIAVNSRGVVFSHSFGNDTVLLALYDDNADGRADRDEVCAEGLSLDNNLLLHGLTVDRAGNVYIVEDASGAADRTQDGGNLGTPRIVVFPDPSLNGFLLDGEVFANVDNAGTQALSGLTFGIDTVLGPVGRLTMTNSASRSGNGTYGGLATVLGTGLTLGASGRSEADATVKGIRVTVEGRTARVLSFNNSQVNIAVPQEVGAGVASVVVSVQGSVTAADDVTISTAHPGFFTINQTGAGEAIALLASGMRYTAGPFPGKFDNQPSVIALFGTGWRNSLPVTVKIGGQTATVQYAGPSGGFPGMDQINVVIPNGVSGASSVAITTANGATSRTDAVVTIR